MKVTIFEVENQAVMARATAEPDWEPFEEFDGKPLRGVRLVRVREFPGGEIQLVEIQKGGHFAMHTSPEVAHCQIIRGRGRLGLPEGREIRYEAPELYVFLPGSLHDWHDIEDDTLLSVGLVKQD